MATTLTDTRGIIALAAAGVALLALLMCVALLVKTRRLARRQRVLLGEHGERDLVAHAADLHEAFEALRAYVDEVAASLDARLASAPASAEVRLAVDSARGGFVIPALPASLSGEERRQAHAIIAASIDDTVRRILWIAAALAAASVLSAALIIPANRPGARTPPPSP